MMTKVNKILVSMSAVVGTVFAAYPVEMHVNPVASFDKVDEYVHPKHVRSSAKVKKQGAPCVFFEDFETPNSQENGSKFLLPDGWTTVATPGYPKDVWHSGGLEIQGSTLRGVSGLGMGYILVNHCAHDSWAYSPAVTLEAGKKYTVSYWLFMIGSLDGNVYEELTTYIGKSKDADSMTVRMNHHGNEDIKDWERFTYDFTPAESGDYYIGFHSTSPAYGNAIIIDDVCVATDAAFYGNDTMDFSPTVDQMKPSVENYIVANRGSKALTLSAKDSSPEITLGSLPLTVKPGRTAVIPVTLDVREAGEYSGYFTLATNDISLPEVSVSVRQKVSAGRVSGYWHEDFDNGFPEGWNKSMTSYPMAAYGLGKSGCMALATTMDSWFVTHFTEMGDKPELSFSYRVLYEDYNDNDLKATPAEKAFLAISISPDGGMTWNEVYSINPETNPHEVSLDYRRVTIPLPEYAGKTCIVKFQCKPSIIDLMFFSRWHFDDMKLGTPSNNDLAIGIMDVPGVVYAKNTVTLNVPVRNNGSTDIKDFTVVLKDNEGNILSESASQSISAGELSDIMIEYTPISPDYKKVYAETVCVLDPVTDNNVTDIVPMRVVEADAVLSEIGKKEKLMGGMPWDFFEIDTETKSIYTANELATGPTTVYGIAFEYSSQGGFKSEKSRLYVSETLLSDFEGNAETDKYTLVYEGPIYMKNGSHTLFIPFIEPYEYKGGNLIIKGEKKGEFYFGGHSFYQKEYTEKRSMDQYGLSNRVPVATFITSPQIKGSVSGTVSSGATRVSGAKVSVKGTGMYVTTDAEGKYTFDIAPGKYTLAAEKFGYAVSTEDVEVNELQTVEADFVLSELPRHTLHGSVHDKDTARPVAGARVDVRGYSDYTIFAGEDGAFTISDVYGVEDEYELTVTSPHHTITRLRFKASSDSKEFEIGMAMKKYPANSVCVNMEDASPVIRWETPVATFSYDSGIFESPMGFSDNVTHELAYAVIGNAFRNNSKVETLSWYTDGEMLTHEYVTLRLFALDEQGWPQDEPTFEKDVNNDDNVWNTYRLDKPLTFKDGFLATLSYPFESVCLGTTLPDESHRLEDALGFYNSHYELSDFAEYYGRFNTLLMIRASGENFGQVFDDHKSSLVTSAVPLPSAYSVYRMMPGQAREKWIKVADHIDGLSFADNSYSSSVGDCQYAVVAHYPSGDSEPAFTSTISRSDIGDVMAENGMRIVYDRTDCSLRVISECPVITMDVVSMCGLKHTLYHKGDGIYDMSVLPAGVYMIKAFDCNGKSALVKIVKE